MQLLSFSSFQSPLQYFDMTVNIRLQSVRNNCLSIKKKVFICTYKPEALWQLSNHSVLDNSLQVIGHFGTN